MDTSSECLQCFMRQAEYTAELATDSLSLRKEIIEEAAKLIPTFDPDLSPPENSVHLYRMISKKSRNKDIYANLKEQSNLLSLGSLPVLEEKIRYAKDPLDIAARLAIAGNIIDYGSHQNFNVDRAIDKSMSTSPAINDLEDLREDLQKSQHILYLADNCGELVFDRLLIELIDKPVTIAVKENPLINDALISDAELCGLSLTSRIISNGTDCPGTPINACSKEFIKEFEAADLIISKGQGNFETLSGVDAPLYFLLMVKCPVVADHIEEITSHNKVSISTGATILMKQQLTRPS